MKAGSAGLRASGVKATEDQRLRVAPAGKLGYLLGVRACLLHSAAAAGHET
jgi:hypothetical protein